MIKSYIIKGMTCSNCVKEVKTNLEEHPDIEYADIILDKNIVTLTINRNLKADELQRLFGKDSKYTIKSEFKPKEKNRFNNYKP